MLLSKTILSASFLLTAAVAPFAVINGTAGDDDLMGTEGDDLINGKAGNDQLRGGDGDDHINGGEGFDFLLGWNGDDTMRGGDGPDIIRGLWGDDVHIGGDGDDSLELYTEAVFQPFPMPCGIVSNDHDIAIGGNGDDVFSWASGHAYLPPAPVAFCVVSGNCEARGGAGYDTLKVGLGSFLANSSDYVLEDATVRGFKHQLRSIATGNTINFKQIEEIEFLDMTVTL